MLDYNSLLIFFKQYNEHYRDFLDFERKKLKLVAEDDINGLTDSIISLAVMLSSDALSMPLTPSASEAFPLFMMPPLIMSRSSQ